MLNNRSWTIFLVVIVVAGGWGFYHRYQNEHLFRRTINQRTEALQEWWGGLWKPMPVISEESEHEKAFHLNKLKEQVGSTNWHIQKGRQVQGVASGVAGMGGDELSMPSKDYNPRDDDDAGRAYED